ncbi:MAG: Nmad5 family putative nucleotide modification protein [Peptostreptococcaceae bacterium]
MTRLTKALREKIVTAATAKAVGDRPSNLTTVRDQWIKDACEYSLTSAGTSSEEVKKVVKKMRALYESIPQGIRGSFASPVSYDSYPYFNVAGMAIDLRTSDNEKLLCAANGSYSRIAIPADHELVKRFTEWQVEESRIKEIEDTVRVNVLAMVSSVTTVEKLVKQWPEVVELLPADSDRQVVALPTVKVDQLNAMIGIPSGEDSN